MSSIGMDARRSAVNTDYDAAQALLDLQSNTNPEKVSDGSGWKDMDSKEDIERAAKLILSCFITSDIPGKSNLHSTVGKNNSNFPIQFPTKVTVDTTENFQSKIIDSYKTSPTFHHKKLNKSSFINKHSLYIETNAKTGQTEDLVKKTRDAVTQTEEQYLNPKIQLMETTIKNLFDRIKSLEAQLKTSLDKSVEEASFVTAEQDLNLSYDSNDQDPDFEMTSDGSVYNNASKYSRTSELDSSAFNDSRSRQTNKNVIYSGILTNYNTKSYDMVPIGDGNATVPSRLLKQINWNSYSSATRKLMTAVFSRRILATHSLTGKPSPAFPNKPAKKRLDPTLVNDIVQTVVERCRVPENVVRTSITTKCADESKMFRTREKNKKKRSSKFNRENVSPALDSESDNY